MRDGRDAHARRHPRAGLVYFPDYLDTAAQEALLAAVEAVIAAAPLFTPRMPRTGKPFSVRMTNCGPLGWVSDVAATATSPLHPETGGPWPPMPPADRRPGWRCPAMRIRPKPASSTSMSPRRAWDCTRTGTRRISTLPVVSLSLGDTGLFRYGGTDRRDPTRSIKLQSGDGLAFGGPSRLAFHGIDRLLPGTSSLLPEGGRINLTLRRVTRPG